MMALETVSNPYLSADTSLSCSSETSGKIDEEVLEIIKSAHQKAAEILNQNVEKLHELAAYLLEKETITGEEFMDILNRKEIENVPERTMSSESPVGEEMLPAKEINETERTLNNKEAAATLL
jgi:cell division protease FtsH